MALAAEPVAPFALSLPRGVVYQASEPVKNPGYVFFLSYQ
jgi:hypothetical protein